jgi:hypothetical protein
VCECVHYVYKSSGEKPVVSRGRGSRARKICNSETCQRADLDGQRDDEQRIDEARESSSKSNISPSLLLNGLINAD